MRATWPRVRLGEVLTRSTDIAILVPEQDYREITVRLWGKGVVLRGVVSGAALAGSRRFLAKAGQFILSRIDARNGATGIVPPNLDGAVVSNDFPLFDIASKRLDAAFLGWLTKTHDFIDLCRRASEGTTNRIRLQEGRFLGLEIALPSLAEQRRIVARIGALAAKIHEARTLRNQAAKENDALTRKTADKLLATDRTPRKPLRELLAEPLMNGLSVPASRLGSGICFAKVGVVNTGEFNPREIKLVDINLPSHSPYWLMNGDIVVSRGNSPEFVGRAAVYLGEPVRCAMPDLLIRVRLDSTKVEARFVSAFFHSSEARNYIASQISGTSSTMPKISQSKLEALRIPVPPLTEQRRIMEELGALQAEVNILKHLQSETAAELDALLPAVLDRAFQGAL